MIRTELERYRNIIKYLKDNCYDIIETDYNYPQQMIEVYKEHSDKMICYLYILAEYFEKLEIEEND